MSIILNEINYFWKLGYNEEETDIYIKKYKEKYKISIDTQNEIINYDERINVKDHNKTIFSQNNFIMLEAIDRFLTKGYKPEDIILGKSNQYDFFVENINLAVKCLEFEDEYDSYIRKIKKNPSKLEEIIKEDKGVSLFCIYTSRLKAGLIEHRYVVIKKSDFSKKLIFYLGGIFEKEIDPYSPCLENYVEETDATKNTSAVEGNLILSNSILMKYTGNDSLVVVPEGVKKIGNAVFRGSKNIKKVILPESLTHLGGDTFYDCENLRELTIPSKVEVIGDNPFANCPKLKLKNSSDHFILKDGGLYDKNLNRLIYFSMNHESDTVKLPEGLISIGKHAFYNCKKLRNITIPKSVRILENNPFSNMPNLSVKNESPHFKFSDGALYNKTMSTLFYFEHSSGVKDLKIPEGVSIIGRHSFFNCQTIKTITIPNSVKIIGYNPFTNCSNLSLINYSPEYKYIEGVLYNKNITELIYCSIPSIGESFSLPNTVKKIGRCSFFGCKNLKRVDISDGVTEIERSSFAKCKNLKEVIIPNTVKKIENWAFFECESLKKISIPKSTKIKKQAFQNCPADIVKR